MIDVLTEFGPNKDLIEEAQQRLALHLPVQASAA